MKIKLAAATIIIIAWASLLPLVAFTQEPAKKPLTAAERKAAREERATKAEVAKAKIEAGLKERAAIFDLQFYEGPGAQMRTFEINTLKGSYRYEWTKEKKLIEGSGVVRVDGCTVTLTDWPRVVATINTCAGWARTWIERERLTFSFVGDDEDEEEEDDDSDSDS